MATTNTDFLPNETGLDLGNLDQRWDIFGQDAIFDNVTITGSLNTGPQTSDSVQVMSTSQSIGFLGAVHTMILAAGGGGGITLTLPVASSYTGQIMKIKKTDLTVGNVTISGTIADVSPYVLSNQFQYVCLESGNGAWQVVGNN